MGRYVGRTGENETLGVGRYRLEGNFMAFLYLASRQGMGGGGDRENEVHRNPLGSPRTPSVKLSRESIESKFDASQVNRFKT